MLDGGFAKFFRDDGQQPVPHAIAKKNSVQIRRIFPPDLPAFAKKLRQCGASKTQQGAHNLAQRASLLFEDDPRMNARESPNARATKNAQQNRLRLIVESMRCRNLLDVPFSRQPAKKIVAQFARRRLDAQARTTIHGRVTTMEFQFVLPRQFRDKLLVRVRFMATQLVIDVRNRKHNSQLGP